MSRHNAIHWPPSIHAKDSKAVKIDIFTGSAKPHGRNMQLTHKYHPTFEAKTSTNDEWNQNSDQNKWDSHSTYGGVRRNNIQFLTFPDENCEIRSNDQTSTIPG